MTRLTLVRSAIALLMICFAAVLVAPRPAAAHDDPCQWTGNKNSNWAEKDNWSNCDGTAPQSHDDVEISGGAISPVIDSLISDVTVANVTLQGTQLYVDVGKTLTVTGQFSAESGANLALDGRIDGAVVVGSGTATARGGIAGPITVNAFATLLVPSGSVLIAEGNVTVHGTLSTPTTASVEFYGSTFTNNGTVSVTTIFMGVGAQTIAGTGQWTGPLLSITGSPTPDAHVTTLSNDVTFSVDKLEISNDAKLAIGTHTMTIDDVGQINVDGPPSAITGSGTINLQGTVAFAAGLQTQPKIVVVSGTTTARGTIAGPVEVKQGAILVVPSGGSLTLQNTLTNNGEVKGPGSLTFSGATFTNNGPVSAPTIFNRSGSQTIAGTGAWQSPLLGITGGSATALANSVTFSVDKLNISNGAKLAIGTHTMTIDDVGQINVAGLPSAITGSGTINLQGTVAFNAGQQIQPKVVVVSGTTTASGTIVGPVEVQTGAVLGVPSFLSLKGSFKNDGEVKGPGSLTFSGATIENNGTVTNPSVLFSGGTQTLSGAGSFATTSVVDINGPAQVTLGSNHQFGKVEINNNAALNITGRTMTLTAPGVPLTRSGGNVLSVGNSTVVYKGTAAQTVIHRNVSYHNLTVDNPAGASMNTDLGALAVSGQLRVQNGTFTTKAANAGGVTIDTGATLAPETSTLLNVKRNWTNNGAFAPGSGSTVAFNGSVAQTIGGSAETTFANLTIANAKGVTLLTNAAVNGKLTLTRDLKNGTKTLTMPVAATSAGNGDVVGRVRRVGPFVAGTTYSFGNRFVSLLFASAGALPSEVTVTLVKAEPRGLSPVVPRRYKIVPSGGSGFSATVRLRYLQGELDGMVESALQLWRFDTAKGQWLRQRPTAASVTANWLERSGVRAFGDWAIAP